MGLGFPDSTEAANVNHVNTFMEFYKKFPEVAAEFKAFAPIFFYVVYSETYLLTKNKKVMVPADIKGLKVGSSGVRAEYIQKMGGASVQDTPPTAYEKLQTGVTDAAFAAASAAADFKLYEVTKYVPDVVFGGGGHPQIMNINTWNKISPEDQKIMIELATEASRRSSAAIAKGNEAALKLLMERGMYVTLTDEQKAEWQKSFEPFWDVWVADAVSTGVSEARAREMLNWWKSKVDAAWAEYTKK